MPINSVTATEIKFALPENITSGDLALAMKDIAAENKNPQGVAITIPVVGNG